MAKAKKRGRPPLGKKALLSPLMVRFPSTMLAAIDAISRGRLDHPGRSAVVRQLVAEAIAARNKARKRR